MKRPSLIQGDVAPGKAGARQWLAAGGLDIYSTSTNEAAQRLLNDERAAHCWRQGFGAYEFEHAVHCYELAANRDVWDCKTDREREAWLRDLDRTAARLLALMSEGPLQRTGFPVRAFALMEVFSRAGHPLPDISESAAYYGRMCEIEEAADATGWTLVHSIRQYQHHVKLVGGREQLLKKPRDPLARRADFIASFRLVSGCGASVVAAVAAVMFDDETIDDRLVRRLTAGRADS